MHLCRQVVERIPEGPVRVDDPKLALPAVVETQTEMESLIFHFKQIFEGVRPPAGEAYFPTEGGTGSWASTSSPTARGKPTAVTAAALLRFDAGFSRWWRGMIADIIATLRHDQHDRGRTTADGPLFSPESLEQIAAWQGASPIRALLLMPALWLATRSSATSPTR